MAKATMAPVGTPIKRTYRAEAAGTFTRGTGVMQGTADDQCKAVTGAGVRVLGIVDETVVAAIGDPISLVTFGECIAIAGQASVTASMEMLVDANGAFDTAEGDGANERAGIARSSAAAENDEFVMFFNPVKLWT